MHGIIAVRHLVQHDIRYAHNVIAMDSDSYSPIAEKLLIKVHILRLISMTHIHHVECDR